MASEAPSLELVRSATDRAVVSRLLDGDQLTRAEIATATGISKPTASEAVRRLATAGLVCAAGRQVGGRGRAGTYYRLCDDVAGALAVHAGPGGVVAERLTLFGEVLARHTEPVTAPVSSRRLAGALSRAVRAAADASTAPVLVTAMSVADPVDRRTGRLVQLDGSPFVTGTLDPHTALRDLRIGRLVVDNDVNWAALAEQSTGCARDLDDFWHLHLGEGIGAGLVLDGAIRRGHRGLAGEAAYAFTHGPGGKSMRLLDCFADWQLTRPDTTAIDVDRMLDLLTARGAAAARRRDAIGTAVAGTIASMAALTDPAVVVLGGPWGSLEPTRTLIDAHLPQFAAAPITTRSATTGADGPLLGARRSAVQTARTNLLEKL